MQEQIVLGGGEADKLSSFEVENGLEQVCNADLTSKVFHPADASSWRVQAASWESMYYFSPLADWTLGEFMPDFLL